MGGSASYLSLSSGSTQSTFWKRSVMNSSGSAMKQSKWKHNCKLGFSILMLQWLKYLLKYILNKVCFNVWVCTFFLCSEGVAAELFTEIHHTLSRHKASSAINTLAISKQTRTHTLHSPEQSNVQIMFLMIIQSSSKTVLKTDFIPA